MEENKTSATPIENINTGNPDFLFINGEHLKTDEIIQKYQELKDFRDVPLKYLQKAVRVMMEEDELKVYQAELIKMQDYLEKTNGKMIILFEGRDASGKGGTIRRVTRYMNEKHYRVVALGKPTEEQKLSGIFRGMCSIFHMEEKLLCSTEAGTTEQW